jgi:hypothetical protein
VKKSLLLEAFFCSETIVFKLVLFFTSFEERVFVIPMSIFYAMGYTKKRLAGAWYIDNFECRMTSKIDSGLTDNRLNIDITGIQILKVVDVIQRPD